MLEPAIVRWLYIRRLPSQSFQIDLSPKGVQKLYDEWDRFVALALGAGREPFRRRDLRARDAHVGGQRRGQARRRVSFRLLAAAADLTQGNREQIGRIVAQHLDDPPPAVDELLDELEPRLSCAIAIRRAARPPSSARRCATRSTRRRATALDDTTREGVATLARELDGDWTLDGLTALVYAIPKVMLGLPRDAPPNPELKVAQRAVLQGALPAAGRLRHRPAAADADAVDRPRAHARAARRRRDA